MTPPPPPLPQYSDLPPGVQRVISDMQKQLRSFQLKAFSCIGGLAAGLVALTGYCLSGG